ncbi:MAG: hypothetical protein ACQESG_07465 [Nanobdellota archaeon]
MNLKIVPIVMLLFLVGCQGLAPETQCEPPARPMTDVNGNTVCVIASVVNQTPIIQPANATSNQSVNDTGSEEADQDETGTNVTENVSDTNATEAADTNETDVADTNETEDSVDEELEADVTKVVTEGERVALNLSATDPEGDVLTYTFSEPLDDEGAWQTEEGDAGEYVATVSVSDGENTVTKTVLIVVEAGNRPPVIERLSDLAVEEGEVVRPDFDVSDPDGDEVTVTFTEPLEGGEWNTSVGDAGKYEIDLTASDGSLQTTESFVVLVTQANIPPTVAVDNQTVDEGEVVEIEPVVSDEDGDELTVSYSGWMNSSTYQTGYDDAGVHLVTVSVSDGTETVEKQVTVTVKDVNRPPVFEIN